MDDQDWAALDAASESGSTPETPEAPSDTPQDLGLQVETQSSETTEPVAEQVSVETPGDETVPDAVAQRMAELERQLAERQQADALKQQQWDARLREFQEKETQRMIAEDQQEAQEFLEELRQTDPEWAQKFEDRRNFLAWSADQAKREAQGSYSALEALTLAVEYHAPDIMQRIVKDATELAEYPSYEQKRRLLEARRTGQQSENAQLAQLQSQIRELQNQLEARNRPIAADLVEGGPTGRGRSFEQQWEDAADFDQAFRLIS